jgi:HAMP domain-containing protein
MTTAEQLVSTVDPASLAVILMMWRRLSRRLRRLERNVDGVDPD